MAKSKLEKFKLYYELTPNDTGKGIRKWLKKHQCL